MRTQSHLGVLCGRVASSLMLVLIARVRVVDATTMNRDVGHTIHSDPHVLYASPLSGTAARTQSRLGVLYGRVASSLMLVLITRVRVVDATTMNRNVGHTIHSDPHVLYASPLVVPDQAPRRGLNRI